MQIIYGILSAIASELTFVFSFILIYFVTGLLHFAYSLIRLKNRFIWMIDGILCSSGSIFLACYTSFIITRNYNFSEVITIAIAIVLPVIGEFEYQRHLGRNIKVRFVGRLHLAMKTFAQRGWFARFWHSASEKMILNNENDKLIEIMKNEEAKKLFAKEAYESTQYALAMIFLWSLLGDIAGIFLAHHFIF